MKEIKVEFRSTTTDQRLVISDVNIVKGILWLKIVLIKKAQLQYIISLTCVFAIELHIAKSEKMHRAFYNFRYTLLDTVMQVYMITHPYRSETIDHRAWFSNVLSNMFCFFDLWFSYICVRYFLNKDKRHATKVHRENKRSLLRHGTRSNPSIVVSIRENHSKIE